MIIFSSLSRPQPGLHRNNVGMMFFDFLNFFTIFLEFSSLGRVGTVFITKILFLFLGLSQLSSERYIAEMMFFLIF